MKVQHWLLFFIVIGGVWRYRQVPSTTVVIVPRPTLQPFVGEGKGRLGWAQDFLHRLGNDQPTNDTLAFVVGWQAAENTTAAFNPLATTLKVEGATCYNDNNGNCVKNYSTYEQGMQANVDTITNGRYPHILHGLATNHPEEALDDGELGTWGTGRGAVERTWHEAQANLPTYTSDRQLRAALVQQALALRGIPYISGGRSANGGDCSGTMQYIFKAVAQRDIGATTYTQLDNAMLASVERKQLQEGDLAYFQYSDDQHVGMVADVNNDGKWDLINNGGLEADMHVDYDFLSIPYFNEHTIGYRSAIN